MDDAGHIGPLEHVAAELRGRMEAWQSDACGSEMLSTGVPASPLVQSSAGDDITVSPAEPDKTREYLMALVHETLEPFRASMMQEHVNTVALAEHWAKVAAESKRSCTQIASSLQESGAVSKEKVISIQAPAQTGIQDIMSSLKSDFQSYLNAELSATKADLQIFVKSLNERLERNLAAQAVSIATTEARSVAMIEAAAALDKVLEVEGKTLNEWTHEFDLTRAELSRHAEHLSSLQDQLVTKAGHVDSDILEVSHMYKANAPPAACCSDQASSGAEHTAEEQVPSFWRALHGRVTDLESSIGHMVAGVVTPHQTEVSLEGAVKQEDGDVSTDLRSMIQRLQHLQERSTDACTIMQVQLQEMVSENNERWQEEAKRREEDDHRIETVCQCQLLSMQQDLAQLCRNYKAQAGAIDALRQRADLEGLDRDEKQKAFSTTVHGTLQMLISKMDSLQASPPQTVIHAASRISSSPGAGCGQPLPPTPLPMRTIRVSGSGEAPPAASPAPFLHKRMARRNVQRAGSASPVTTVRMVVPVESDGEVLKPNNIHLGISSAREQEFWMMDGGDVTTQQMNRGAPVSRSVSSRRVSSAGMVRSHGLSEEEYLLRDSASHHQAETYQEQMNTVYLTAQASRDGGMHTHRLSSMDVGDLSVSDTGRVAPEFRGDSSRRVSSLEYIHAHGFSEEEQMLLVHASQQHAASHQMFSQRLVPLSSDRDRSSSPICIASRSIRRGRTSVSDESIARSSSFSGFSYQPAVSPGRNTMQR